VAGREKRPLETAVDSLCDSENDLAPYEGWMAPTAVEALVPASRGMSL